MAKDLKILEIDEQMLDIACEISALCSIHRILIKCLDDSDDLKEFDIRNLSNIIYKKVLNLKDKFDEIVLKLEI